MERILELLGYLITGMLAYKVSVKRREWRQASRATKNLTSSVEVDSKINARLAQLLFALEADRAKLFRFHNGDHFFSGQSVKRFSLTHIQLKNGVSGPVAHNLKDMASSFFPNMLKELLKSKSSTLRWHVTDAPDSYLKTLHAAEGTVFVKVTAIWDVYGQMLGFLSINWLNAQSQHDPGRVKLTLDFAREIGLLLSHQP